MSVREWRAGAYSILSREAGPPCFSLSMYSPAPIQACRPMDSEILTKPLSLWPGYSTDGLLILLETGCQNEPQIEPQKLILRALNLK